jgi:DNA-binding response OmpR family regulator
MRLLLVEPHHLLARALTMGMSEEGFAVEVVGDQQRADERLRECAYDVILLDLFGGECLHTFQRWRRAGLRTPVLMLTTSDNELNRPAESVGDNFDISVKPFDLEELLARIRRLVRNGSHQDANGSK